MFDRIPDSLTRQHLLAQPARTALARTVQRMTYESNMDSGQVSNSPQPIMDVLQDPMLLEMAPVHPPQVYQKITSGPRKPLSFKQILQDNSAVLGLESCNPSSSSSLPLPSRKGDFMSISIYPKEHQERVKFFDSALIGRLMLSRGDKPWTVDDLKNRLQEIWKPRGSWFMSCMGKGFFTFRFATIEERDRIWSLPMPPLKPGVIRLQQWTPFFNPYKQRTTTAQVWVRFYELGTEYYYPRLLWNLARCLGTPLKIDQRTLDGSFTHFARILVEIDLSKDLETHVQIDHGEGLCVYSSVGYERIPEFCKNCNMVGHAMVQCRKNKSWNAQGLTNQDSKEALNADGQRRRNQSTTSKGNQVFRPKHIEKDVLYPQSAKDIQDLGDLAEKRKNTTCVMNQDPILNGKSLKSTGIVIQEPILEETHAETDYLKDVNGQMSKKGKEKILWADYEDQEEEELDEHIEMEENINKASTSGVKLAAGNLLNMVNEDQVDGQTNINGVADIGVSNERSDSSANINGAADNGEVFLNDKCSNGDVPDNYLELQQLHNFSATSIDDKDQDQDASQREDNYGMQLVQNPTKNNEAFSELGNELDTAQQFQDEMVDDSCNTPTKNDENNQLSPKETAMANKTDIWVSQSKKSSGKKRKTRKRYYR